MNTNNYLHNLLPATEYEKIVRRPYPPLILSSLYLGQMITSHLEFGGRKVSIQRNVLGVGADLYYAQKEIEESGKNWFELLITPDGLSSVKQVYEQREDELIEAASNHVEYSKFEELLQRYSSALTILYSQDALESAVRNELQTKIEADKVEDLMHVLNIPLKANMHRQEELDLLMTDDIESHAKKYVWFEVRYGADEEYSVAKAAARKEKIDKEKFTQENERMQTEVTQGVDEAKKILGSSAHIIDAMQWLVWFRTQRTDVINKATALYLPKYKELAEDLGLTYLEFLHVTRDEFLENRIPLKEIIKERQQGWAYYISNIDSRDCVSGDDYKDFRKYMNPNIEDVRELRGSIANKGLVKGTVRVIMDLSKLDTVEEGDIIVTSMTTPNMITAMKRAAAFVTDEGGITCHAAVISREMNKPCVIGTKMATKVFKDGDQVEVDANNGVVKVID